MNTTHVVCLMGHSRLATAGKVNVQNAHPMNIQGKIIGMHNGTVNKHRPDYKNLDEMTDSLLLYESILAKGLYPTLANLYVKDAYALTFYDTRDGTVNIIRNDERPLVFAETKSGALFWASEARMLELALGRNNIEITQLVPLKEGLHWKYNLFNSASSCDAVDLDKYKEKPSSIIPGLPKVIFPEKKSGGSTYNDPIPFAKTTTTLGLQPKDTSDSVDRTDYIREYLDANVFKPGFVNKPSLDSGEPTSDEPKETDVVGVYRMRDRNGKEAWVDPRRGRFHLRQGCCHCKSRSKVSDVVYWISPDLHICESCYQLPVVQGWTKTSAMVKSFLRSA